MTLPNFFYAEPQFRASRLAAAAPMLKAASEWTLDTPGIGVVLALDYYKIEAFATKIDRDAACGATGHDDVRYVPVSRSSLRQRGIGLDDIACGYCLDHPRFEDVIGPIIRANLRKLVGELPGNGRMGDGVLVSTAIMIGRARFTISANAAGDWIRFPVEGMAVFERANKDMLDRTVDYLQHRLMLEMSPDLIAARQN